MRKIKFRAKQLYNNKFIYGSYVYFDFGNKANAVHWIMNNERICHDINQDTLGQFIGLLDINGVEIYEGDIVKMDPNTEELGVHIPRICQVNMDEGCLQLFINGRLCAYNVNESMEVLGNIYEYTYDQKGVLLK